MSSRVGWWMVMVVATLGCARGGGPDWDSSSGHLGEGAGGDDSPGGTTSSSSTSGSSSGSTGGGGTDGVPCAPQEKLCGGICKDVTSDPSACGDCYNASSNGEPRVKGQCPEGAAGAGTGGTAGGGRPGACSPLAPETVCGSGSRCTPQPNGSPTGVGPTGSGSQYTYCTTSAECDAIHECVNTGSYWFCLQWCTIDTDCPIWYDLCVPLEPAVYVGTQSWGICHNGVS